MSKSFHLPTAISPYDDPESFVTLSYMLESVGTSAYLGGAKYLENNTQALDAAGTILTTEARHSTWVESSVNNSYPWSGSFDTPLTPTAVYSLASQFITDCPSTNPALPLSTFPGLNITSSNGSAIAPGSNVTLAYNSTSNGTDYLAFFSGMNTTFAEISGNQTTIPDTLQGLVYAVVSNSNSSASDSNVVAGPVILSFTFGADVSNY